MNALRKAKGTLGLAESCITAKNRMHLDIILAIVQPTLDAFYYRIKHVNTPAEHKAHFLKHASGEWQMECLEIMEQFTYHLPLLFPQMGQDDVSEACSLAVHLAGQRASSHFTLHKEPPFRYALAVHEDKAIRQKAEKAMMREWKHLLEAEQAWCLDPTAVKVLETMHWRSIPLTRLLFHAYESGNREAGFELLNNGIEVLPDNKLAEDTHQRLRDLERAVNTDTKLSAQALMTAVLEGKVLEKREITAVIPDIAEVAKNRGLGVKRFHSSETPPKAAIINVRMSCSS